MIGRKSLMEVSPEVTGGLKAALEQRERFDLSSQVARMTVPSQHVRGNAEDFTFSVIVVGRTADE
jgi:hypothetical protein